MSDNTNNVNAPHNWTVHANTGINLTATNMKSGEVFNGTTADFNTLISADVLAAEASAHLLNYV